MSPMPPMARRRSRPLPQSQVAPLDISESSEGECVDDDDDEETASEDEGDDDEVLEQPAPARPRA